MAQAKGAVGLIRRGRCGKKVTNQGKGTFSRPNKKKANQKRGVKAYKGQGK